MSTAFDPEYILHGCPKCKSVNMVGTVCDEWGCWEPDTIGTPTGDGYRRTCHTHAPKP